MPGRRPIPVALKKEHMSNEVKRNRAEAEAKLIGGTNQVKPPKWLDRTAAAEFRRLAKELLFLNLICNADVGGLAIACDAYSKYIMASSAITPETISTTITKTSAATTVKRTSVTAVEKYATIYRAYCSEYGLTPAARIKLASVAAQQQVADEGVEDEDMNELELRRLAHENKR